MTKSLQNFSSLLELFFKKINENFSSLMTSKLVTFLKHKKHFMGQLVSLLPMQRRVSTETGTETSVAFDQASLLVFKGSMHQGLD